MDTLKLAKTESTLWAEAQVVNDQRMPLPIIDTVLPSIPGNGVLQMVRGKRVLFFQDKVGSVLWKVSMDC